MRVHVRTEALPAKATALAVATTAAVGVQAVLGAPTMAVHPRRKLRLKDEARATLEVREAEMAARMVGIVRAPAAVSRIR